MQRETPEEGAEDIAEVAVFHVSGQSLAEWLHCSLPGQLRAAIIWEEGEAEEEGGREVSKGRCGER